MGRRLARAQPGDHRGAAASSRSTPGLEMRAGRDGAVCQILLTEPRVSGTHATLKFEGGQLLVRDENSNNGTYINGQRLPRWRVDPRRRPGLRCASAPSSSASVWSRSPRFVSHDRSIMMQPPAAIRARASRSSSRRRAIRAAIRTSR